MSLLLFHKRGLITNGLIAIYDPYRQIVAGNTGQTLIDYSGKGNNAQLGSTSSADTNDPSWTGNGLKFTTDDYCSVLLNNNLTCGTAIVVFEYDSTSPAWSDLISFKHGTDKHMRIEFDSLNRLTAWTLVGTENDIGNTNYNLTNGENYCTALSWNTSNAILRAGNSIIGSSIVNTSSSLSGQLYIGARCLGSGYCNTSIKQIAVYNRTLSDAEYLHNYNYLKSLMSQRGITI